jgi:hypothetical protein
LAWWAADDRGNWFLGRWQDSSTSDLETEGEITFGDRFDPKALVLRLMPSGLHTRAVIEIALPRKLLA